MGQGQGKSFAPYFFRHIFHEVKAMDKADILDCVGTILLGCIAMVLILGGM